MREETIAGTCIDAAAVCLLHSPNVNVTPRHSLVMVHTLLSPIISRWNPGGLAARLLPVGLGLVAMMGGQVLIARGAGPEAFGLYSYVMAIIGSAAVLARAGYDSAATNVVTKLRAEGKPEHLRPAALRLTHRVLIASMAACVSVALFVELMGGRLVPGARQLVWLGLPIVPLLALAALRSSIAQGLERTWLAQLPETILRPTAIGAAVICLALFAAPPDAAGIIKIALAVYILTGIGGVAWLLYVLPRSKDADDFGHSALPQINALAGAMGLVSVTNSLIRNFDIIVVGALVPIGDLAIYVAASRLAECIMLAPIMLDPIVSPRIAYAHYAGDSTVIATAVREHVLASTVLAVSALVVFIVAGTLLLGLFGPGFAAGAGLLSILAFAYTINCASGPARSCA
jgi:O-antigen/teichoic acid export membrane protein